MKGHQRIVPADSSGARGHLVIVFTDRVIPTPLNYLTQRRFLPRVFRMRLAILMVSAAVRGEP